MPGCFPTHRSRPAFFVQIECTLFSCIFIVIVIEWYLISRQITRFLSEIYLFLRSFRPFLVRRRAPVHIILRGSMRHLFFHTRHVFSVHIGDRSGWHQIMVYILSYSTIISLFLHFGEPLTSYTVYLLCIRIHSCFIRVNICANEYMHNYLTAHMGGLSWASP